MNLIDIRERMGPYWAAYQATRRRDNITDNPDFVPPWFVAKLARERVAAARVAVEQLARPKGAEPKMDREIWEALRTVEQYIREGNILDTVVEQVVAGLLGAQEIETERERRDAERRPNATASARFGDEFVEMTKRHLIEDGITTSGELAAKHADEDAHRERVRAAQWRALDEIAEEARA